MSSFVDGALALPCQSVAIAWNECREWSDHRRRVESRMDSSDGAGVRAC